MSQTVAMTSFTVRRTLLLLLCSIVTPQVTWAQSVVLQRLDGSETQGTIKTISEDQVALSTSNGEVLADTTSITRVLFSERTEAPEKLFPQITLVDGSLIRAHAINSTEDGWQLTDTLGLQSLEIPKQALFHVQFVELQDRAAQSWTDLLAKEQTADVLAVLRNGDLETLNGAIIGVDEQAVRFELDGQLIPAPRSKVSGLVWLRRNSSIATKAVEVVTIEGSRLRASQLSIDGSSSRLNIELLSGTKISVPLERLLRVDYSTANLQWLDQVEVMESTTVGSFGGDTIAVARNKLLAPKFLNDSTANNKSDSGHKSLVFQAPGKFVFRVPEGYTQLMSVVQRNRSASVVAPIKITIKSDDQTVLTKEMAGEALRAEVNVKLQPNKRCEIVVESASNIPFGAQTTLVQPYLLP